LDNHAGYTKPDIKPVSYTQHTKLVVKPYTHQQTGTCNNGHATQRKTQNTVEFY